MKRRVFRIELWKNKRQKTGDDAAKVIYLVWSSGLLYWKKQNAVLRQEEVNEFDMEQFGITISMKCCIFGQHENWPSESWEEEKT